MSKRKKLLTVSEASFLNTGFATYSKRLLTELHNSDKYEVAELGIYGKHDDQRAYAVPWKFYANMPTSPEEEQVYGSNFLNQFGAWRFEQVCLDFKPDIVFSILDPWMNSFQIYSPFRKHYNLVYMPTIDAIPLLEDWVYEYMELDNILAYTRWGIKTLREFTNNKSTITKPAPGGCDESAFKPILDKKAHKEMFGLRPENLIVGMVARNQVRKLFPELISSFSQFLNYSDKEISNKTFLYLHTSYPDIGWDIPRILNHYGIGHKVIFTYYCRKCGTVCPLLYQDARTFCRRCGDYTMSLPHVSQGIPVQALGQIVNLFDVYVQYSNCEGLSIPPIEAGHCDIPLMVVNYSGMEDFVNHGEAIPIEPKSYNMDIVTGRSMASPDENDFITKLNNILSLPDPIRRHLGYKTGIAIRNKFNWKDSIEAWVNCFDNLEPKEKWNATPVVHNIPNQVPDGLNNDQFVRWVLANIAGRPELSNKYLSVKICRDLNWGVSCGLSSNLHFNDMSVMGMRPQYKDCDRNSIVQEMIAMGQNKNNWELRRYQCK